MIDYNEDHFRSLCGTGRVAIEISTIEDKRAQALRQFWLRLVAGIVLAVAIGWWCIAIAPGWGGVGFAAAIGILVVTVIVALLPLGKAGKALKQPALETLAQQGGMAYLPAGFDPPVYADARKALFGKWLSAENFTDLFWGTDPEGRRYAFYEAALTRRQGKNTVTIFSGQIYAFQRRARSGGEIVVVPDRGLFNFFKPLSGMERVKFENDPEFEKKFEVYAYQPHEATALLGPDLRRRLLALRQAGRVFAYVGPEDVLVAATGKDRFEAGSMFRATSGQERVRAMFDEVRESLANLRDLKAALD